MVLSFSRERRNPATDGAARRRRLRVLGQVHPRGQLRRRRDAAGHRRAVGRRCDEEGEIKSFRIFFI